MQAGSSGQPGNGLSRIVSAPSSSSIASGSSSEPRSPLQHRTRASSTVDVSALQPRSPRRAQSPPNLFSTGINTLQSHLYQSGLLQSFLSDVHVCCFGRVYKLHKIVLGQSGFFRSLLDGGFSEQKSRIVQLELDSPMSRKAFEFCLARLYGGGPNLVQPAWARTEPEFPLSAPFELLGAVSNKRKEYLESVVRAINDETDADNVELATPDFVLSLLATATYLEIPDLQSLAYSVIQKSLTPWTVSRFVRYALGKDIAFDSSLDGPCVGLEAVARPTSAPTTESAAPSDSGHSRQSSSQGQLEESMTIAGPFNEQIGQACAIWLCKWGSDILSTEQSGVANPPFELWTDLPASWVRMIISSDAFFIPSARGHGEVERYEFAKRVVELRRRPMAQMGRRELSPARSVSSDLDEGKETESQAATSPTMDQQSVKLSAGDEAEYSLLFETGIHYSHFSFEQLVAASNDVSPSTRMPYVSQRTLERAIFASQRLRNKIPSLPFSLVNPSSPLASMRDTQLPPTLMQHHQQDSDDKPELGLTTSEILNDADQTYNVVDESVPFYVVPVDETTRINESGISDDVASQKCNKRILASPDNLFGLAANVYRGYERPRSVVLESSLLLRNAQQQQQQQPRKYTPIEPKRFCAEFWSVADLKDKQRLYSDTFFYAGSYYNLYLQKLQQKKGAQLGIYLHRQNHLEAMPSPSRFNSAAANDSPDRPTPTTNDQLLSSFLPFSQQSPPDGLYNASESFPSSSSSTGGASGGAAAYIDKRKSVSAFFSVWCPNALANSMTRFASGPDAFAVSQSWGWKSSSLKSDEYIGPSSAPAVGLGGGSALSTATMDERQDGADFVFGVYNSLRVCLVLGLT